MELSEWLLLVNLAGGTFNALYDRMRVEHGDKCPTKDEILAKIAANQAEIDAGRIPEVKP